MNDTDLLWPRYDRPEDLAAIEQFPLAHRGLPATTYEALQRAAALWPDRLAVSHLPDATHYTEPVTTTFTELLAQVHAVANVLHDLGVGREDAVLLVAPNCAQLHTALLATQAMGIAVPINPSLSADHAVTLAQTAGAKVILAADPDLDPRAWQLARALVQGCEATALVSLSPTTPASTPTALEPIPGVTIERLTTAILGAETSRLPVVAPSAGDLAAFFHTGGTTGIPKLAAHTHRNEVVNGWMLAANTNLRPDATLFAALPLFHVNALIVTTLAPLLRGQHVVWAGPLGYRDLPLYGVIWRLIEHYRIATLSAVPTVYSVLSHVAVDADISSLQFAVVGASPLPPAVRAAFYSRTNVELCEGYGLTEATCASARSFPGLLRPGAVGQRFPYQQVRVVDPDSGQPLTDPDAVGELAISGPTVFAGYVASSNTGRSLDYRGTVDAGWLRTGDLARVDADGFVHITGRAKDLIIRGGHNIDPVVIEDALLAHPQVTGANAVGSPDAHSGEVPVAYVTVSGAVTADELCAWAAEHVPESAAAPKSVHILESLPVTDIGKPFKPALRADAAKRIVEHEIRSAGLDHVAATVTTELIGSVITVTFDADDDNAATVTRLLDNYALRWRRRDSAETVQAR